MKILTIGSILLLLIAYNLSADEQFEKPQGTGSIFLQK